MKIQLKSSIELRAAEWAVDGQQDAHDALKPEERADEGFDFDPCVVDRDGTLRITSEEAALDLLYRLEYQLADMAAGESRHTKEGRRSKAEARAARRVGELIREGAPATWRLE